MHKALKPLLFLGAEPVLRERVRRACEGHFVWMPVSGWAALADAIRTTGLAAIAVVDPYHGERHDAPPSPELRRLLRRYRSLTLVAVVRRRPEWLDHIRLFGEWGVAEVMEEETHDTTYAIRRRLGSVRGRPLRNLISNDSLPLASAARGRAILEAAVDVVALGGGIPELVEELGASSEDTLLRWSRHAGLPVPRRLLIWIRALIAAELLDNPASSLTDAAVVSGYASDDTLRRALRTVSGATPTQLRQEGAWDVLSRAFIQTLEDARPLVMTPTRVAA